MCRCMNYHLKDVAPTIVVWDLDEAEDGSTGGAGEERSSTSNSEDGDDQFGLPSSSSTNRPEETSEPQVRIFLLDLLDNEDSIRFHRSALADASRTSTCAEGCHQQESCGSTTTSTIVRGGIRPSANTPMSQELESLDDNVTLWSEEQDDLSTAMTQDSMDLEEFELLDLNDEPGQQHHHHYISIQQEGGASRNFCQLALSLELGNHDSGYSQATDDNPTC